MPTYLLTGAAGFVGSKVAEILLERGDAVVGVDNLNQAYDVRLKHWRLDRLRVFDGFEFHELDILDLDALSGLFAANEFAAVINLAARAGVRPSVENPRPYFETNALGSLNVLTLCQQMGVSRYILASTSSLYGAINPVPYREDADTDRPLSPYAASKKAAETTAFTYHHLFGLDITILRYFTVYGPAGRPDMSPFRFVQAISEGRPISILGDGLQSRDFTYIDDIARGTVAALDVPGFEVINLGAGRGVVLLDTVQIMEKLIGRDAQIEYLDGFRADMRETLADVGKAAELLGWKAEVGFEEGASNLVDWYAANRSWASKIDTRD